MQYHHVISGRFLQRPNRFIAHVETQDGVQIVHVKNTGIRDVPADTLVAGNPARVIRKITPEDRKKYQWAEQDKKEK